MKRFLFLAVCIFSLLPPSLARACSPLLLTDSSPLQESVYPLDSLQRDTIAAIAPTEPVVAKPYVNPWSLAVPAVLIARGAFSIDSHFDHKLQRYVVQNVKGKVRADDYVQ